MAEPRILSGQNQLTPALTDRLYLYRPSTNDSAYSTVQQVKAAPVTTVTATSTLTAEQAGLVVVNNTGAVTMNLPTAVGNAGLTFIFKKGTSDAFAVTLDPAGSETIDGGSTVATIDAQHDTITIVSDGANWRVTARIIA